MEIRNMEIFLDTADISLIEKYRYFIDGVTTNPSLMASSEEKNHISAVKKICSTLYFI